MEKYKKFLALWVVNALLLYLANMLLPSNFELGNSMLSPLQATAIASFIWNWVLWHTETYLKDFDIKLKDPLSMMSAYFLVNFASIWIIARFAVITGVGISSYLYVLLLAALANFVQFVLWRAMENKK